jgi:predicted metal-dependent hydrolase
MHYFNLPFEMKDFLRHYIVHDVIDYSLARSKISLICDYDNSYVLNLSKVDEDEYWESYVDEKQLRLVIPFGASITELKNFITAHQDFIKEKQQLIGERKKNSPRFNAKRDARVMQLVAEGKSYKQVAKIVTDEFGVPKSQGEIGVIVKRQRDSKK